MIAQIARRVRSRHALLASLAAVAAVCMTPSAQAAYDSGSSSNEVTNSCKDPSVDTNGVLSATCNTWKLDGTVTGTKSHTIDLDGKIGFEDGKLQSGKSDFSGQCDDESISATSDKWELKATCAEKSVGIRIDNLLYSRGLETGTIGIYWKSDVGRFAGDGATTGQPTQ